MELPSIELSPVWHPYTPIPIQGPRVLLTRASGSFVEDASGRRYFDATSSWWCNIHGHCHPELVDALTRQAAELDQVLFAPHSHSVGQELAACLLDKLGHPFEKIFFSDNGSTAVEAALKVALQYWSRIGEPRGKFLSLERAYHGDTLGAVSVGHVDTFHTAIPQLLPTFKCPIPDVTTSVEHCLEQALGILENHGHEIAALIVEPLILGASGMIVYSKEYLEKLTAAAKAKRCLVIFDEVFTGFGRTGTFFAKDQISTAPDVVCMSKGLTSGMLALGATAMTRAIFNAFEGGESKKFFNGHTFSANPLACAVALQSLKIFDRDKVIQRNESLMALMAAETARFEKLETVSDVRHLGMIWVCQLKDPSQRWRLATAAWDRGIWVRPAGPVLYVIPPYCTTVSDLQQCFDVLYEVMQ